jgi:hypothetical protein
VRLSRPLLPLLLLAPLLGACTSDDPPARATFTPPPASAFADGPCALVGDDLVALGRATYSLRGVKAPDQAAKDALRTAQDRVDAVAQTADPSVQPALSKVVVMAGLVRIQSDTQLLVDATLDDLRTAYDDAVRACSAGTSASPAAG